MDLNFPAYFEKNIQFDCDKQVFIDNLKYYLILKRWSLVGEIKNQLLISINVSFWSWGEKIILTINDNNCHMRSECTLPTQCFD